MSHLVVIGDVLLDRDVLGDASRFTPDAPAPVLDERELRVRPGGAGLAALLAARDGHEVTLVTALAGDDGGVELRALLSAAGVTVVDLGSRGRTAEKIRLVASGRSLARWDRGGRTGPEDLGAWTPTARRAVASADAVLVSCYGRGMSGHPGVRDAVAGAVTRNPVVWDPHPRGAEPVAGTAIVTPNRDEASRSAEVGGAGDDGLAAVARHADALVERWRAGACVVTLGADGALFSSGAGLPLVVPAPHVAAGDPCGAGDRFAAAVAGALASGSSPTEAVTAAVHAASRFVAAGGAGTVRPDEPPAPDRPDPDDASVLARRVRAAGGTVVATGGCFDLLHTGHVHVLEAARALGDCLIVCLNSDRSVARLKGPGRPIVGEDDRAALLRALGCVDAVAVFDDDTPVPLLRRLRPHVFAKGGDYGTTRIPEADVLASWGGQAVTVPYLHGRSTTRILEEVRDHGDG